MRGGKSGYSGKEEFFCQKRDPFGLERVRRQAPVQPFMIVRGQPGAAGVALSEAWG